MVERWGSAEQLGILQQVGTRATSALVLVRLYAIRPATELGGVRRVGVDARNAVRLTRQIRSLSFV